MSPLVTTSADVAATFDSYAPAIRAELLVLRQIILDTAAGTPGVGVLEETLKWGQPAYGSAARIGDN